MVTRYVMLFAVLAVLGRFARPSEPARAAQNAEASGSPPSDITGVVHLRGLFQLPAG